MKLRKPKFSAARVVRECADALDKPLGALSGLSSEQLRAVAVECDRLSQTNCWWLEFRVAPLVKQEALETLSIKEK